MHQIHRLSKYLLPFLILLSAILALLRFNSVQLGTSYDDAHYIILAESLSSGQGYQLTNFPRTQIERAFPPGWPMLLTPLAFLFPGNYLALKLLSLIIWLATFPLIYRLFSKRIESPYLEILIGLMATNPLLVGTSVTVMSETAYLFFSLIVLVIFDSWHEKTGGKNYWTIILVAIFALYSQLIRTVGISIFAALLIYLLFTRRFREAGITIGVFALGMLLQAWINLRNGGSLVSVAYESQVFNGSVVEKIGQMWSNLLGYFDEVLAGTLVPVFGEKVTTLVGHAIPMSANTAIIFLIIFGIVLSLKRFHLMDIYVAIYLIAILAFWNPRVGSVKARFLIPIIPFLYFYMIQGMKSSLHKLTKNNDKFTARIIASVAGLIVIFSLTRNFQDWRNPVRDQMTDLSIGAAWISQNSAEDAIIMVNEPVPAYVHLHRKTVAYPADEQDIEKYLNNQGVDYIIISPKLQSPRSTALDDFAETQLLPFLKTNTDEFVVVYGNSEYNVTVYKYEGSSSSN